MGFDVIIPARYASTRLPGKPLLEVAGKPLIQWVYESAGQSAAERILVATDDDRILARVERFGGEAYMTGSAHKSGTDRIAELTCRLRLPEERVVVNVQGDEPNMPGALIDQVAQALLEDDSYVVSTACHRLKSRQEFLDPNVVKVVRDRQGRALYFSRAPIPWNGEGSNDGVIAHRHIGIYGYRSGFLPTYTSWQETELEKAERLEQLRILENGVDIKVCEACAAPGPGIDTTADLDSFKKLVSQYG